MGYGPGALSFAAVDLRDSTWTEDKKFVFWWTFPDTTRLQVYKRRPKFWRPNQDETVIELPPVLMEFSIAEYFALLWQQTSYLAECQLFKARKLPWDLLISANWLKQPHSGYGYGKIQLQVLQAIPACL